MLNKVVLIGRLGRDPEVRLTGTGTAVCTLSLATDEHWTDAAGAKQQRTEWHRVVVFGKQGETCGQYLQKGRQVYIEGSIRTRKYDQDGLTKYITEMVASRVQFLGGREDDTPRRGPSGRSAERSSPPAPADDDIPSE